MQDRYLFRGKRMDNGEWVYWNRFGECTEPVWTDEGMYSHIAEQYVDPATVGRCTGLKDKNGRLVFEDDVITGQIYFSKPEKVEGMVEYDSLEGMYCAGGYPIQYFVRDTATDNPSTTIVIIGNIHKSEVE